MTGDGATLVDGGEGSALGGGVVAAGEVVAGGVAVDGGGPVEGGGTGAGGGEESAPPDRGSVGGIGSEGSAGTDGKTTVGGATGTTSRPISMTEDFPGSTGASGLEFYPRERDCRAALSYPSQERQDRCSSSNQPRSVR